MNARLLLACACLALSGCAALERFSERFTAPPEAAAAPPAEVSQPTTAAELVAYMGRLKTLNEAALNAETTRQRQLAARDPSDVTRLKLAMALVVAPQSDESDILAVVDPLAKKDGSTDEDIRTMASFLQGMANERRRLKESAAVANAKLRDERKARETEKQRADQLQERAAQLQQKLDALTDLEKSLSDRRSSR